MKVFLLVTVISMTSCASLDNKYLPPQGPNGNDSPGFVGSPDGVCGGGVRSPINSGSPNPNFEGTSAGRQPQNPFGSKTDVNNKGPGNENQSMMDYVPQQAQQPQIPDNINRAEATPRTQEGGSNVNPSQALENGGYRESIGEFGESGGQPTNQYIPPIEQLPSEGRPGNGAFSPESGYSY